MKTHCALLVLTVLVSRLAAAESLGAGPAVREDFPAAADQAVSRLLAFAAAGEGAVLAGTEPLVRFVRAAAGPGGSWTLPARGDAAGSAYIVTVKVPLQDYLALNFNPRIPDYAAFPASLRYSACLDPEAMTRAYAAICTGPTGDLSCAMGRMTGMEEITPNPESGSYFSYTNTRTFFRGRVDGRDVLFSCSTLVAPSTLSCRGVPVGPLDQALFYYSGKPGLNLTGMTWILSQIRSSTTVSIYVALSSNETAVATLAWLNAGWKGLNVIRSCHILNSQRHTLDFSRRIAEAPGMTAARLAAIVDSVDRMTEAEVNSGYASYLAYVRTWRDSGRKGFFSRESLLEELFDSEVALSVPLTHRRALIVQERVRTALGIPTWSIPAQALARK